MAEVTELVYGVGQFEPAVVLIFSYDTVTGWESQWEWALGFADPFPTVLYLFEEEIIVPGLCITGPWGYEAKPVQEDEGW